MRISEAPGGIQLLLTLLSACGIYFPDKMCDRDTASKSETDYRLHSSTRKTTRTTRRPIPSVIRILTTKAVVDRRLRARCCHLESYFKHTSFSCRYNYYVQTWGRLKTQVRKTKVPEDGICKYGIRKYEYARVENASRPTENASTNLQRWKTQVQQLKQYFEEFTIFQSCVFSRSAVSRSRPVHL